MRRKYYTKNNRFISVAFSNLNIFCFVLQIEIVTRSIYNIYNEGGTLLPIMLKLLAVQRDLLIFSWNKSSIFDSTFTRDRVYVTV